MQAFMVPNGLASLEHADGGALDGAERPPAAISPLPASGSRSDPARLAGLLAGSLALIAWAAIGACYGLISPVQPPMGLLVLFGVAGLGVAATICMVLERILRRGMQSAVQQARAEQRAFIQQGLDQLVEGIAIWDSEDRLEYWNRGFEELMPRVTSHLRRGMTYDALLRVWIDCGYAPRSAGPQWIQDCLESRWLGKSRDTRRIEERDLAFIEQSNDDGVTAMSITDVTSARARERALKDSEERYSLALIASNEALWDYDLRTGKTYLSRRAVAMIGAKNGQEGISRETWIDHIHPEDAEAQASAWERHLRGESEVYGIDYRVIAANGEIRWVYDRGVALRDSTGSAYRIAGSLGDITDRKRTEADLTSARDAAQLADRARTEFLSNLTHEFKTPLNVVIGFSEILVQGAEPAVSDADRRSYLEEVHQAGKRLDRLVSDLLDLARTGSSDSAVADSQVDLNLCIGRACELVAHRAEQRSIDIALALPETPLRLIGDLGKLKHAMVNLLGYAIGMCDAGGAVAVSAAHETGVGHMVRVEFPVCGVTSQQLHNALKPLTPEDAPSTTRTDGIDLALAVVESFVTLHDGVLELSVVADGRASAVLQLPQERVI